MVLEDRDNRSGGSGSVVVMVVEAVVVAVGAARGGPPDTDCLGDVSADPRNRIKFKSA